jgi:hypothetical protein
MNLLNFIIKIKIICEKLIKLYKYYLFKIVDNNIIFTQNK